MPTLFRPFAAVLLALPYLGAAAQQPPPPTLQLSTRIVVLDLVVTDKAGKVVTSGLTRDDFSILEDKAPQTIRSFEPPEAHALPAGITVNSAADLKRIGDAPVTLLVLDELNTRFEDMAFARQSTVKYLEAQGRTLGQPTALLVATNTRFIQLHDYTQDRDELISAVKHHLPELPTKRMAGRGGAAAVERMAQSLAALEQIAQSSLGTPGRKNVVWVGNGFPSADLTGLDTRTGDTVIAAIRQCTAMLLAARITMFTINPTLNSTSSLDVQTPDDLSAAQTENGGEMLPGTIQFANFAPATGGRSFASRNDLNREIAEGIAQGNNYYTLSYSPTDRSSDAQHYRRVQILMRDKSLHATTRNGYYPPTAATANATSAEPPKQARAQLQLDLSSAVNSSMVYNGLAVTAVRAGDGYTLHVKPGALSWRPVDGAHETSEVTVMAAWYNEKNKLLGHSGKELTDTRLVPADPGSAPDATFSVPLALPAGVARLRFVLRDAGSASMGTVDLTP